MRLNTIATILAGLSLATADELHPLRQTGLSPWSSGAPHSATTEIVTKIVYSRAAEAATTTISAEAPATVTLLTTQAPAKDIIPVYLTVTLPAAIPAKDIISVYMTVTLPAIPAKDIIPVYMTVTLPAAIPAKVIPTAALPRIPATTLSTVTLPAAIPANIIPTPALPWVPATTSSTATLPATIPTTIMPTSAHPWVTAQHYAPSHAPMYFRKPPKYGPNFAMEELWGQEGGNWSPKERMCDALRNLPDADLYGHLVLPEKCRGLTFGKDADLNGGKKFCWKWIQCSQMDRCVHKVNKWLHHYKCPGT